MDRVLLRRDGPAVVATVCAEDGTPGAATALPAGELPGWVAAREAADAVRWVWDDTTRWYPALLDAGVRVARCTDLRLSAGVLRRSPYAGPAAAPDPGWAALEPVTAGDPALFDLADPADSLDPLAEHRRQQAAVAASPHRGRLGLLLAAESSGALAAAEMTWAGLPWRADEHGRLLTGLLGDRPPAGLRPPVLERLAGEVRAALRAPDLNPDSATALLRALQTAGLPVEDTRSWTLEQYGHPVVPPLLEYKRLARLLAANGWAWLDTWVRDGRFRPVFLPGGVVTGRWASSGGGALSVPVQVRPAAVADDGRRLVVADVAQLEPRVLAGMSGDAALAEAARAADLYAGMVAAGVVASRAEAKLGVLGALYGGTRGESGRVLPRLAATRGRSAWSRTPPGPASGARSCTPGSAAAHRHPAARGRSRTPTWGRRPSPAAATPTAPAGPSAGSPATSSSRAPARSGRCAGWPTCATGSGGWVRRDRWTGARTWCSSCTTRSSCTPRRTWPRRSATRSGRPRSRPAGCCSATSPSTSRSTCPRCAPGPTPDDPGAVARGRRPGVVARGSWLRGPAAPPCRAPAG